MHWKTLFVFMTFGILLVAASVSTRRSGSRHHHQHHPNHLHQENIPTTPVNEVDDEEQLALLHSQRVMEAGSCEVPKLQVIHVNDHYPGRYYLPHCTLLHRCGKHAGCCGTDRLRCAVAEKEKVVLHFYSVKVRGEGMPAERKIEKLAFTNHTRCACAPVDNDL